MKFCDDGDIVRALGFVALNYAYAEDEIDDVLALLARAVPSAGEQRKYHLGDKAKWLGDTLTAEFHQQ